MTTGIYQITNTVNGWVYVGSSVYIEKRFKTHKGHLKHNHHSNSRLQADANRYGLSVFTFSALEILPDTATDEEIDQREQYHTEQAHKTGKCYNPKLSQIRRAEYGTRVCRLCGAHHYCKNMCEYHWARWKRYTKTVKDISPEDYISQEKAKLS